MSAALAKGATRAERSDRSAEQRPGRRVLMLYEPGRSGAAALAHAAKLISESACELTVVALAAQDTDPPCCGVYVDAYNRGVRDDAIAELCEAQRLLGPHAERARFELLVEGSDPPLEAWAAAGGFQLVLLPARRRVLHARRHPLERRLRRSSGAEVRVITASRRSRGGVA